MRVFWLFLVSATAILKYQNTEQTHYDNQQGSKEPWYAMGKRVRLRPVGESLGYHLCIRSGKS